MIMPDISREAKRATNADIIAAVKTAASSVASAIIEVITVPIAPTARRICPHTLVC